MIFPPTTSFTPLSTIPLASPHFLHPKACNPAMDLVVLLSPFPAPESKTINPTQVYRPWINKAKEKEKEEGKTRISLWRTGQGDQVWEVDVVGRVGGLAWMEDGLHLSVLLMSSTQKTVDTLSVHTGETARTMPVEIEIPELNDGNWVDMEYTESGLDWEKPSNGSALMILDSLPKVTPVEPPKAVNVLPFMQAKETTQPKASLHPKLLSFPSLLPSNPPTSPVILQIHSSKFLSLSLLTGTFPFSCKPSREVLSLAQISGRMLALLDVVLRGLEQCDSAFRASEKETMIHREELETNATQQGISVSDVHADLFRFLMSGRTSVAVSDWLGSHMTPRTITKWDSTLDTSFRTIQKLISGSINPAVERVLLLLEELKGWSLTPRFQGMVHQQVPIVERMNLVAGLSKLCERIRYSAEHEMMASAEFMKWLKYESSRSVSQDRSTDEVPYATHDVKLVWSFMQNGFVNSSIRRHFPDIPERPPGDLLSREVVAKLSEKPGIRSLDAVLQETLKCLRKDPGGDTSILTAAKTSAQFASMSMVVDDPLDSDEEESDVISTLSDDSVAQRDDDHSIPEVVRVMEEEPWVWVNTVVESCGELIRTAVSGEGTELVVNDRGLRTWTGLKDTRSVKDGKWIAVVPSSSDTREDELWLIRDHHSEPALLIAFKLSDEADQAICLALQFFDDVELVLLFEEARAQQRYLVTIRYEELLDHMLTVPADVGDWNVEDLIRMGQSEAPSLPPIPISRSRPLSSRRSIVRGQMSSPLSPDVFVALNGRKGRRTGCVLVNSDINRELEALDLDADEDAYEDEEMDDGEEHSQWEGGEE